MKTDETPDVPDAMPAHAPGPHDSRVRRALLKTQALGAAILGSETFSIIATDEHGVIQMFNVGAERMLGYAAADVVDRLTPSDMHDPHEVTARARALSLEFETPITPGFAAMTFKPARGLEDSYEVTYVCKNGSRFPAIVSVTALRDPDNAIIGYLLIGTDNSVRKLVEAELLRAKAAAEKANVAKSDFLSSMSHELRSPLNAILGFAQLMDSDAAQPARDKVSTGHILKAGWYLLDLINEILDLAMIESGKMELSQEPTALDRVLLDCRSMIEPQAASHRIAVDMCQFESPCYIQADHTRVKQVLLNLLSNAIKYNRSGGSVSVACDQSSPAHIRIRITDTGAGLAPEKLAQLFQPFNRLGQDSSVEGTGIGLVMTKRLVELMGGVIGVESTVGQGSVFWIDWLRAVEPPALVPPADGFATGAPAATAVDAPRRTLLYVEDNPANLSLVEQLIARRPTLHLLSALDAMLGLKLAREHVPDVILMDINLPGISGIRALRMLREDPVTQHIPVVAVSANAMPNDIRRGLEAGFFRYLTKPIKVDDFMSVLDAALAYAAAGPGGATDAGEAHA